jgi:hypothetical protein
VASTGSIEREVCTILYYLSIYHKWQESTIEPAMQCIELDEWEEGIDWEGAVGSDDDDEEDGTITKVGNAVKGGLNARHDVVNHLPHLKGRVNGHGGRFPHRLRMTTTQCYCYPNHTISD